jgi:hypothetical protein
MWSALATHPWAYPAVEVVHLVGVALLLGNLVAFELRVFGLGAALPLADLARLSLTLAVAGFALAALSGLVMFATQPLELLANRAFTWKMGLLALAGLNAAAFHARGSLRQPDAMARVLVGVSTVLWLAVLGFGRWIAYA